MVEAEAEKFAQSHDDASERASTWNKLDPFPSIPPALLNSGDIEDYLRVTGMVYPVLDNDKNRLLLKSASFECRIGSRIHYWPNATEQKKEADVKKNKGFTIRENSIVFIETYEYFWLPEYIAMRFNLRINLVHRGFLLGTGPLVDPGFEGRLLIPVHNLTSSPCDVEYGERFIWAEFTKTSPINREIPTTSSDDHYLREGRYRPFPEAKKNLSPEDYFKDASYNRPIVSSIPEAVRESQERAVQAQKQAEKAAWWSRVLSGVGLIGILTLWATFVELASGFEGLWKSMDWIWK